MKKKKEVAKAIFNNSEHVDNYEAKTRKSNWAGPEIMFGLAFKHVKAGDRLLDFGIGTGLCSELFNKADLLVSGMDFSAKMLDLCRSKNITVELKEHNLKEAPYPFGNDSMDHVVCGGVLHLLDDISPVFEEASRITRSGGLFILCNFENKDNKPVGVETTEGHITIPNHSAEKVEDLLKVNNFEVLKTACFKANIHNAAKSITAYITKNIKIS